MKVHLVMQARIFCSKYRTEGLRTLDSIQLSTSLSLFEEVSVFFTADKLLKPLFEAEGLPTYSGKT